MMFIYGGGNGKVVCEIAQALGLPVEVFVDDNFDLKVVGNLSEAAEIPRNLTTAILEFGNNQFSQKRLQKF